LSARATILLGAAFAALVAAFVVTSQRERRIERAAFESKKLFDFAPADVRTLSIQQQGAEPVEAIRRDGGWELTGSYRSIPANSALWDQLAEVVAVATNERPIPGGEDDLAGFGLAEPRVSVIVGTAQGVARQIDFGGLDPTQRHRYLRMSGVGVFLSSAEFFSIMNRSLLELRDRRVFTNLADGLHRFEYERYLVQSEDDAELNEEIRQRMAGIHDVYAKDESGRWRMAQPAEAAARQDRLEALERVLPTLGGRAYVDEPEDPADYGLDRPFARMTAYGPDGRGETLLLGGVDSAQMADGSAGLYLKRDGGSSVIVVDARLLTLLPAEPEAFRERRLFTREAAHLKTLRYEDPSRTIALDNGDDGWTMVDPAGGDTDQVAASMYIAQLKRIEGRSFPAGDVAQAFSSPRITLEFTYDDGGAPSRVVVGSPVPGSAPLEFYARQDLGAITTISFEEFQTLQAVPFDFLVKTLLYFDPRTVAGIDVSVDGVQYRFGLADGRWEVLEPRDSRLDANSDVTTFLSTLAATHATGIADPAPGPAVHQLDSPVLSVTLHLSSPSGGSELGPVRVGQLKAEESRERFASVAGRDAVYFVDQSLIDAARRCVSAVRGRL
jgi:hypothetical protein